MRTGWRRRVFWLWVVSSMLFSFALVNPPIMPVSAEGPVLSMEPNTTVDPSLTPGEIFYVEITVNHVEHMFGYGFKLVYDTDVLTAENFYPEYPFTVQEPSEINDTVGYVDVHFHFPYPELEGLTYDDPDLGFTIIWIEFSVDALGASPLNFENSVLVDVEGAPMPHDAVDGFFANEIHDIAITGVTSSPTEVTKPDPPPVYINVTVVNEGEHTETFDVTAYYDDTAIETKTDVTLDAGADTLLEYTWDTTFVSAGTYIISANATVLPTEPPAERADNSLKDGTVTVTAPCEAKFDYEPKLPYENQTITFNASSSTPSSGATIIRYAWDFNDSTTVVYEGANLTDITTHNYTAAGTYNVTLTVTDSNGFSDTVKRTVTVYRHDVAIVSVTPDKTEVDAGTAVNIDVTVRNEGDFTESFNVTAYYDDTAIGTQIVTDLAAGAPKTLSFLWGTSTLDPGTYTLKAVASTVPGEIDTSDNTFEDGEVTIHVVRDITVKTPIYVSATKATPGEDIEISVTVFNYGMVNETFDVSVYYDGTPIDTLTVTELGTDKSKALAFTWNTTGVPEGTYMIKVVASTVPGETNTDDNEAERKVLLGHHDIAVTDVTVSKTKVIVGESVMINATVENQGNFTESFNVTAYYDDTAIGTANVTELGAGESETLNFTWVTTGVAGTYTIKVVASTVPRETDTDDNTLTGDTLTVKYVSSITISADPTTLTAGETTTINGSITPTRAGVTVTISYKLSGEDTWNNLTAQTDENGQYSYDWTPTTAGTYEVKASWTGDATTLGAESDTETITVEETSDFTLYLVAGAVIAIALAILAYVLKVRKPKQT